jgi:hypothetical protein
MIRLDPVASTRKIRNTYESRKTLVGGGEILGDLGTNGKIMLKQFHNLNF